MAGVRIAVIGGGSGGFPLGNVKGICLTPNLHGSTVCLMDVDAERLNDACLARGRLIRQAGAHLELEQTPDRRSGSGSRRRA